MKQLIVTADDFGLTKSINEGIAKAYKEGIVTFLNFIPTGEAFDDAARLAQELKPEEIGAHLSLSETIPVSDPQKIPTLTTRQGRFYPHYYHLFAKFLVGAFDRNQAYLELRNQLERLQSLKVKISNLSSHEHIHMMPGMLEIFIRLAKEFDIPSMRYPRKEVSLGKFNMGKLYRSFAVSYLERGVGKALKARDLAYTDNLMGFLDSGKLTEDLLCEMIGSMPKGVTELVCHPGFLGPEVVDRYRFHLNCEAELFALTSPRVKKAIEAKGIQLTAYQKFIAGK